MTGNRERGKRGRGEEGKRGRGEEGIGYRVQGTGDRDELVELPPLRRTGPPPGSLSILHVLLSVKAADLEKRVRAATRKRWPLTTQRLGLQLEAKL